MPKYQTIANILRERIHSRVYDEKHKLPTELALCEEYGASRQTIRHALSLLEKEGLIERLQGSGSHVRDVSKATLLPQHSVAVITTYISDYIFPSILREIENVFSRNGCTPMLYATKNQVVNERSILENLLNRPNLDGVLAEGTKTALPNPNLDLYRKLMERNVPLVFINGNYRELDNSVSVMDDNFGGGYQLVKYLHGKGHVNIAGIFKSDDIQGHQRYAGYSSALLDARLPLRDSQLFWYTTEIKDALSSGSADYYAEQMLAALRGCSAVVCYNDEIASMLLLALLKNGIKVPEQIALTSFDNSLYSERGAMRITSLSHEDANVGKVAAEIMIKLLNGEHCESVTVPWKLIEKMTS